jgi:hypothetical protein
MMIILTVNQIAAQEIRECEVKRNESPLEIDGRLDEPQWQAAVFTELFIHHQDGTETILSTRAKFLWDDQYLYVGFDCEDPDVWATLENRDDHLWNGEVVEILCDPDGNGLNYFEVQVNPLETILDLTLDKAYSEGGQADLDWDLDSIKAGVWIEGTLNDSSDVDVQWQCEVALPFDELVIMAPTLNFPPLEGDEWRILVTRYDYKRKGEDYVEVSAWNQTNSSSFHVPERFGRIFYSAEDVVSEIESEKNTVRPVKFGISKIYPNPFNPITMINYQLPMTNNVDLSIYNILGQQIATLVSEEQSSGNYQVEWDASGYAAGIYFLRILSEEEVDIRKITLLK